GDDELEAERPQQARDDVPGVRVVLDDEDRRPIRGDPKVERRAHGSDRGVQAHGLEHEPGGEHQVGTCTPSFTVWISRMPEARFATSSPRSAKTLASDPPPVPRVGQERPIARAPDWTRRTIPASSRTSRRLYWRSTWASTLAW